MRFGVRNRISAVEHGMRMNDVDFGGASKLDGHGPVFSASAARLSGGFWLTAAESNLGTAARRRPSPCRIYWTCRFGGQEKKCPMLRKN